MESTCNLCSNQLTSDEAAIHPCDCGFLLCSFCFQDLTQKLTGNRKGQCPQCAKLLNPRFRVDQFFNISRKKITGNLRQFRVLDRNLVELTCPPNLSKILDTSNFCGKYGKIVGIMINHTYQKAFVRYQNETQAVKCILGTNGFPFQGSTLQSKFAVSKYCNSFLAGKRCVRKKCLFLHKKGENNDHFRPEELREIQLQEVSQVLALNTPTVVQCEEGFPNVSLTRKVKCFIPKASQKYKPKFVPLTNVEAPRRNSESEPVALSRKISLNEVQNLLRKNSGNGKTIFSILDED